MKTIHVVSRDRAMATMRANPGSLHTLYCSSKYKPDAFPVGRAVEVSDHILAVFASRGCDRDGSYSKLHCIREPYSPSEKDASR